MTKVSVIIPSYNSGHYLKEALDSALAQTFMDYEVVVVNDGSTDSTEAVIRDYEQRYPEKIRYIYQNNKGLAAARNTAIQHVTGEYLALLDADDRWLPERLAETVAAMDADQKLGIVHANITRFASNGNILDTPQRDTRYLTGMIFEHIFLRRAHLSCPTVLIRRRCIDKVGLFDENLSYLGCEDRELWLRIAQRYAVHYIDKVLALYRISPTSMSHNQENMLKGRLYVVDKFCPPDAMTPAQRRLRRQALAQIYRDRGDEFLLSNRYAEARKGYAQAIRQAPFGIWSWINYLKACRLG